MGTKRVMITMTPEDYEAISELADAQNMSFSEFLRTQALRGAGLPAVAKSKVEDLAESLGKPESWVVARILTDYFARRYAEDATGGGGYHLLEFTEHSPAKDSTDFAIWLTTQRLRDAECEQERVLLEQEQYGISPEETEWLKSRRKGRAWHESAEAKAIRDSAEAFRTRDAARLERIEKAKAEGLVPVDCRKSPALICGLLDELEGGKCTAEDLREMLSKSGFRSVGEEGQS